MAQALPVIGYVVGGFFGYPQLGALIGAALSVALAPDPEQQGPGDLSAPKLSLGSQLPRVYGRVRLPVNPISISDYRPTAHEADTGKGGPDAPVSYTYSLDVLGAICDGSNVLAITRQWFNKKIIYSALADSSAATLANSQITDYYSSIQLFTGGPAQMPAPLYEDRVGAANAPANRNVCTVEYGDVQCGGGKQPPLMEVEIITAGSQEAFPVVNGYVVGGVFGGGFLDYSVDAYFDDIGGGGATGEAFLAFFAINTEGHPESTGMAATLSVTVDEVVVWTEDLSLPNEASIARAVQINHAVDHTQITLAIAAPTFPVPAQGNFQLTLIGLGGTPGYDSVVPDQLVVESGDANYGIVSNGTITAAASYLDAWREELIGPWTPATVSLADIISAELLLNPEVSASDFDVSELEDIEVIGYTAIGPPAQTVAELCDIHYVDIVPGNPYRFQRRGGAAVVAIPYGDTGAGANDAGDPFAGLKRGNADESPAVAALNFPLIERDHEAGYERGDRLATDSDDVRRIQTRVVMTAAMGKGRAITATLQDRVRRHTASYGLSDKYAALEPADVVTATDNDGNTYRKRLIRLSYADNVKSCDWELDDATALVEQGITDNTYTPSVEIVAPGVAQWLPLDIPLQRDSDTDPGYYLAVKCSDDSRVYVLESANDVTYGEVGVYPFDAVFGTVAALDGTLTADGFFDEASSITVDVGDGSLSSATREAVLADRSVNAFVVGPPSQMLQGQFRTATLVSEGVYTLTGLLLGAKGTERWAGGVSAGDDFCLRSTGGGVRRQSRTLGQLGAEFYIKGVPERRSQASIAGRAFTNTGVSLMPLSPVQLRIERDASTGDIAGAFVRRTRLETRFGGDYGDACPLGEESERYRVRIYTSGSYATVVRDLGVVTSASFAYSAAQQIADFGSVQSTVYVGIAQISATVGEGYELQDAA